MVLTKQKQQKLDNQTSLLRLIRSEIKISQAELSLRTKLQPSTVSYLVRDLKQTGLVKVSGKGESGELGGKKSRLLSFNNRHGNFSGIYLKKEAIHFALFDFSGKLIEEKSVDISSASTDDITRYIINNITYNYENYPNYKGAGIAVSSVIDNNGDISYSSGNTLKVVHFHADIKNNIPPVNLVIDNDANCAAYYSNLYLKEQFSNLITYTIYLEPFGIGAGIIIDNRLYKGANGAAGEIWETLIDEKSPLYDLTVNDFNETNRERVELVLQKLENFILSTALFMDTQAIIITGDFVNIENSILERFVESLKKTYTNFEVHIIDKGDLAIYGAAMLSMDRYINSVLTRISV